MPETSTPSTTPPTTAAPLATIQRSNQEPDIIIGLSVSVFGLIFFLVAVGVVTKICNDKYECVIFTLYNTSLQHKKQQQQIHKINHLSIESTISFISDPVVCNEI